MKNLALAVLEPRRVAIAVIIAACVWLIHITVDFTGLGTHLEEGVARSTLDWVKAHPEWMLPIICVLAFGESIAFVSLVLPFWAILVGFGPMLTGNGYNFYVVLAVSAAGAATGDWLSYWLGYHYHEQIAKMYPFSKHPGIMEKGHAFFEKWGVWAIVIARFSGPLRASVPIIAGAVQMPSWKFQLANWGSAVLWAWVLLGGGTVLVKCWSAPASCLQNLF